MEAQLYPYLTFNGSCREAMQFYQACLGGELYIQTIGDSGKKFSAMPDRMRNYILHAALTNGTFKLMGSDIAPEKGLVNGNSIVISLQSENKTLIDKIFKQLSMGGEVISPVKKTQWGTYFGSLIDKFNKQWLLTCNPKSKTK